jgi:hypothetical protein
LGKPAPQRLYVAVSICSDRGCTSPDQSGYHRGDDQHKILTIDDPENAQGPHNDQEDHEDRRRECASSDKGNRYRTARSNGLLIDRNIKVETASSLPLASFTVTVSWNVPFFDPVMVVDNPVAGSTVNDVSEGFQIAVAPSAPDTVTEAAVASPTTIREAARITTETGGDVPSAAFVKPATPSPDREID